MLGIYQACSLPRLLTIVASQFTVATNLTDWANRRDWCTYALIDVIDRAQGKESERPPALMMLSV